MNLNRFLLALILVAAGLPAHGAEVLTWLTDLPTAQAKAREENKFVFLDFTGSDWCGWCKRLKSEVFDQQDFVAYAREKLVLVEVDFPQRKPQSAMLRAANARLASNYSIQGYPTILVLDQNGKQAGQAGYQPGGPRAFIASLERMPGLKQLKAGLPSQEPAAAPAITAPPSPPPPVAVVAPVPPPAPNLAATLSLKGISGSKGRRFALINNETLMAGETAKVKAAGRSIEITCQQIRDDGVVVWVDGKAVELKMAGQ